MPVPWPHQQERFSRLLRICSQALLYAYQFECLLLLLKHKPNLLALLELKILMIGSYKLHHDQAAVLQ